MLKRIIRKLVYHERSTSKDYIDFLKRDGADIGNDVNIFNPETVTIDATRPFLLSIGNHVNITRGG